MHLSFLVFYFFLHELALLDQLGPLHLDMICLGHFLLYFFHQFLLFIFLNLHDPLNVLFFIQPLHHFFVLLFFQPLLPVSLNSNQILFLTIQFIKHLHFCLLHSSLVILSNSFPFHFFFFFLPLLLHHLLLVNFLKFSLPFVSFGLSFEIFLFPSFLHRNVLF